MSNSLSRGPGVGHGVPLIRISATRNGKAMVNRSAAAVKGGRPPPMTLLAITVLPTRIMAEVR